MEMERIYFYRYRAKESLDALWQYEWSYEQDPEYDPVSDFGVYLGYAYNSETHEPEYLGMITYDRRIKTFFYLVSDNDLWNEVTDPFWDEFALFLGRAKGDPHAFRKPGDEPILNLYCYRYRDKAGTDLEDFQTTEGKWIYEWCHSWTSEEQYNKLGFPEHNLSVEQGYYLGNEDEFHPDVREVEYLGIIRLPEKFLGFFALAEAWGGRPDTYFLDPIMEQAFAAFAKTIGDRSPMKFDSTLNKFVPIKPLSNLYDR